VCSAWSQGYRTSAERGSQSCDTDRTLVARVSRAFGGLAGALFVKLWCGGFVNAPITQARSIIQQRACCSGGLRGSDTLVLTGAHESACDCPAASSKQHHEVVHRNRSTAVAAVGVFHVLICFGDPPSFSAARCCMYVAVDK